MKNESFVENIVNLDLNDNYIDVDSESLSSFHYNIKLDQCQDNIDKQQIKLFSVAADIKEKEYEYITKLSTELFLSNVNQLSKFVWRFAKFIQDEQLPSFDFTQQETENYTFKQLELLAPFINFLSVYDENSLSRNLLPHRFVQLESKHIGVFSKMNNIYYLKLNKSYTEREIQLLCANLDKITIIDASYSPLNNGIDLFDKIPSLQLLITQDKVLCQKEDIDINFQDDYQIIKVFLQEEDTQQKMWEQFKLANRHRAEVVSQTNHVKTMIVEQQMGRMPPQEVSKSLSTSTYYQEKLQSAVEASKIRQAERERLLETIMHSKKADKQSCYKSVYQQDQQQENTSRQMTFTDFYKKQNEEVKQQLEKENNMDLNVQIQQQPQQQEIQQQQEQQQKQEEEKQQQMQEDKPLFGELPPLSPKPFQQQKQVQNEYQQNNNQQNNTNDYIQNNIQHDDQSQLTQDQLLKQSKQIIQQSNMFLKQGKQLSDQLERNQLFQQRQHSSGIKGWRSTDQQQNGLLFN